MEEVVNYVRATNHGLRRLSELPLCNRLIREIHGELMRGVRGSEREPGEFRRSQNWIGPANCTLNTASFVPPPPHALGDAMGALESWLHDRDTLPPSSTWGSHTLSSRRSTPSWTGTGASDAS